MKTFDIVAVEQVIGGLSVGYPTGPKYVISDDDSVSSWYRRSRLFQIGDVVGVMTHSYGYYMSFIGQVAGKTNGTYDVKLLFRHPKHEDMIDGKRIHGRQLWYIDSPELRTLLELEPKPENTAKPQQPGRKRMAEFSRVLTKAQKKLKRYGDIYVALDELKVSIDRANQLLSPEDMDAVTSDMREALSTVREQVQDIRDGGEMYKEMNWNGEELEKESSSSDED